MRHVCVRRHAHVTREQTHERKAADVTMLSKVRERWIRNEVFFEEPAGGVNHCAVTTHPSVTSTAAAMSVDQIAQGIAVCAGPLSSLAPMAYSSCACLLNAWCRKLALKKLTPGSALTLHNLLSSGRVMGPLG